jgi:hypothetical protein
MSSAMFKNLVFRWNLERMESDFYLVLAKELDSFFSISSNTGN